ncbi:MAG: caspase family protein [Acidobacteriaceae bacterium]|nr:caspase family protein [Acidobacteriaceae bacterium]
MTRRGFVALTATALGNRAHAQSPLAEIGAAKDLLCQGLELLSARSDAQQITRAVGFFGRALDEYPSFGDAHYYRYLCLKKLNREKLLQDSALEKAQRYHSEALLDQRDPFVLAVPKIYDNLASVGQKWALVIGISRFQPDTGAESLKCPANDASAFAGLLRDTSVGRFPDKQVFVLINEEATTAAIKRRLNTIATKAKSDDVVVIYLSTHGSSRTDDIRQVSYVYTYDTDVSSRDDVFATALPMVEISSIVSTRCLAQRTILIFDTCHSGASGAAETLSSADANRLSEGAGRFILCSCQANQRSYENAEHGYFTSSLIDNLRQRQGCIRLQDLFTAVRDDVSRRVLKERQKPQEPVMFRSERAAEIIFGSAPEAKNDQCVASVA